MTRSRAFSLIEITLVLLLVAIAAAVVTVRMSGPAERMRMRDAADRVAQFDRASRAYALEHDESLRLVIDLSADEIARTDADGEEVSGRPLRMPGGWSIARLIINGEEAGVGSASVSVSRRGLTPSYAVLLTGPADRSQWILVTGLGGEVVALDDENQLRDILEDAQPRRHAD